jgi:hypothetical protein
MIVTNPQYLEHFKFINDWLPGDIIPYLKKEKVKAEGRNLYILGKDFGESKWYHCGVWRD